MIVPHCQSFLHIWAGLGINVGNFSSFVSSNSKNPATFMPRIKNPPPANRRGRGQVWERPYTRGRRFGRSSGKYLDQAVLRGAVWASAARRLAMNAARRVPRAHGITVSFSAAACVIDLMKRALVFMALVLGIYLVAGCCPCLR